jgi:hypothetical protein
MTGLPLSFLRIEEYNSLRPESRREHCRLHFVVRRVRLTCVVADYGFFRGHKTPALHVRLHLNSSANRIDCLPKVRRKAGKKFTQAVRMADSRQ